MSTSRTSLSLARYPQIHSLAEVSLLHSALVQVRFPRFSERAGHKKPDSCQAAGRGILSNRPVRNLALPWLLDLAPFPSLTTVRGC